MKVIQLEEFRGCYPWELTACISELGTDEFVRTLDGCSKVGKAAKAMKALLELVRRCPVLRQDKRWTEGSLKLCYMPPMHLPFPETRVKGEKRNEKKPKHLTQEHCSDLSWELWNFMREWCNSFSRHCGVRTLKREILLMGEPPRPLPNYEKEIYAFGKQVDGEGRRCPLYHQPEFWHEGYSLTTMLTLGVGLDHGGWRGLRIGFHPDYEFLLYVRYIEDMLSEYFDRSERPQHDSREE